MMSRTGRTISVALVLVGGFVLSPCGNRAQAAPPGPDSPGDSFWRRNVAGPGPQLGAMDRRLEEIAEAFGRGEFAQVRHLAQALLDATDDATLRAEAAGFVVQSHLAEGDFESARAAAERLSDQESLTRVKAIEANYKAEVGRLQRIVATTKDPAEAARAQLLTARAHEAAYQLGLAERSYWKVIQRYPDRLEAGDALWQVAQLHRMRDDVAGAVRSCASAGERHPDSSAIAAVAAERIASLSLSHHQVDEGTALLLDLSRRFPRTVLSAWARFRLGDVYWRSGRGEEAADTRQRVWESEPNAGEVPDLLERLAEARYRAGTEARARGELQDALAQLAFLATMPTTRWRQQRTSPGTLTLDMAECHLELQHWEEALELARRSEQERADRDDRARALYVQGCAHWALGDYDSASRAWLAGMNGYPTTEYGAKSRERMRP